MKLEIKDLRKRMKAKPAGSLSPACTLVGIWTVFSCCTCEKYMEMEITRATQVITTYAGEELRRMLLADNRGEEKRCQLLLEIPL